MQLIVIMALLIAFAFVNVYFGRKTQDNAGNNIGSKYMKEHWGIDEDQK